MLVNAYLRYILFSLRGNLSEGGNLCRKQKLVVIKRNHGGIKYEI